MQLDNVRNILDALCVVMTLISKRRLLHTNSEFGQTCFDFDDYDFPE